MRATPGYSTVGFWATVLSFFVALAMALTGYEVGDTGGFATGLAMVASILAAAGYAVKRGQIKFSTGADAKPWYAQTEFYLSVAALVVGLLIQSDVFDAGGQAGKVLAGAASILAMLGYGAGLKKQSPTPPKPSYIKGPLR